MKIEQIEVFTYRLPHHYKVGGHTGTPGRLPGTDYYVEPQWAHAYSSVIESCLVKITAEDDSVGWGEVQAPLTPETPCALITTLLGPALLGKDALATSVLHDRLYPLMLARGHAGSFLQDGIAGLDLALWDLKARRYGVPIFELLGGPFRLELPAYVSGLRVNGLQAKIEAASEFHRQGCAGVKLFTGGEISQVEEEARDVRAALGAEAFLAVDAICKYSLEDAIRLGRTLDELRAAWLEAPLNAEDREGHAALARAIATPVAVGETLRTPRQFEPWLRSRALAIAQPDIMRTGITGALRIATLAETYHVPTALHTGVCTGIGMAATWQVAAVLPGNIPQEHQHDLFEKVGQVLKTQLQVKDGKLLVPETPGIGVEVDDRGDQSIVDRTLGGRSDRTPPCRESGPLSGLKVTKRPFPAYGFTMMKLKKRPLKLAKKLHSVLLAGGLILTAGIACGAEPDAASRVEVRDGVVLPARPVADAIDEAMQFLRKADGDYVPGTLDGDLAGYFTSAYVNEDGSRTDRRISFPARQHAYFIFTFLRYYAYTGKEEWRARARDLADWNLTHSTPPDAFYPNVPYSTFSKNKPGGSRDGDSIEPDKCAFLGSAYIALYEATGDEKYLSGADAVAATLASRQREDNSWPFRVIPESGEVKQEFGGAPVFFVEFFENILRHDEKPVYRRAFERSMKLMVDRNIERNLWGTYHEDIVLKPDDYLSAEPVSFTADYLARRGRENPKFIEMARRVLRPMEERLVHTEGHAAAPAPAVSEQVGYQHLMPGHTARYCVALANLYALTGNESDRRIAMSGFNAVTYMQSEDGLFRTYFHAVRESARGKVRPNWYSQHLYTVCHVLEAMASLPELAPDGEDHLLGGSVFVKEVQYSREKVRFETIVPARTYLKLSFEPSEVSVEGTDLKKLEDLSSTGNDGWSFDPETRVLLVRHQGGAVEVK